MAFDIHIPEPEDEYQNWFPVQQGGPEQLAEHSDRSLLLCYPDDFEDSSSSMAEDALLRYKGDTVIHIGEVMGDSLCKPGCWGRTTAHEAQVLLNTAFHCIFKAPLPSWNTSRDTITIWKRTRPCVVLGEIYAHVPESERLSQVACAPCCRHLIDF